MVLTEEYLLACSEKSFEKLYLESLGTDDDVFNRCERARCKRHTNIYSIIRAQKKPAFCGGPIRGKQNNKIEQ